MHMYSFKDARKMKREPSPFAQYKDGGWCDDVNELAKVDVSDEWITVKQAAHLYWKGMRVVRASRACVHPDCMALMLCPMPHRDGSCHGRGGALVRGGRRSGER